MVADLYFLLKLFLICCKYLFLSVVWRKYAKKEINNLKRVLNDLTNTYPDLKNKKILIIEDEKELGELLLKNQIKKDPYIIRLFL